jgi:hypothetical protein
MVSGGRPCGTSPTMATPRVGKAEGPGEKVVTTTAPTGPALARCRRAWASRRVRSGAVSAPCAPRTGTPWRRRRWQCDRVDLADVLEQRHRRISGRLWPCASMPRMCLSWLTRDEDARGGDEAGDHRVERKLARKPSRKTPWQQEAPDRKASVIARRCVPACPARRPADGGRGHQRDHRHRPDRQRAAGAEDRVEDDRQDRGVEPGLSAAGRPAAHRPAIAGSA